MRTFTEAVQKINAALTAAGYKATEAKASIWSKEINGIVVERIYLKGNGYAHVIDGKWATEGIKFTMLYNVVTGAL
jgi:hypothetical protein